MARNEKTDGAARPVSSEELEDELESLYLDLLKWCDEEEDRERAEQAAGRLDEVLAGSPEYAHSARGEEVRSIQAELRGDLLAANHSRKAEIRKILEMHSNVANTAGWNDVS